MPKTEQAVILAAGEGTRLWPLGETRPKVLAPVLGSTVLEEKLSLLSTLVEEVVLIVGAHGEKIRKRVGSTFEGLSIKYVEQERRLGTGHALKEAESELEERFLVLNGDDIYGKEGLVDLLGQFPAILVKEVEDVSRFGTVITERGRVLDLMEKPKKAVTDLANIGAYFVPRSVLFSEIEKSERGEYEITDYIKNLARKRNLGFVRAETWFPLSYPWHLLDINEFFLKRKEGKVEGRVEKEVRLKGKVVVEEGALLKSGTYVEGPVYLGRGVRVGPSSHLRAGSVLREGVKVGQAVEVKASLLGRNSQAAHLTHIADSVVGSDCNLGAGTVSANLRFDEKVVRTEVGGEMVSTGRRKFGAVLGDGVKTGVRVSIMPGVMIGPGKEIMPSATIDENLR